MFRILKASKDAYITNKQVKGKIKTLSNTGGAASLDLFKIHDSTLVSGSLSDDISRILIKFDTSELKDLLDKNLIDPSDQSFKVFLKLSDVYGGQPTPSKFNLSIFPLSSSFDEGIGRDVSYYSDFDVCNWITSSKDFQWISPGCNFSGSLNCDYINDTEVKQFFEKGDEDLYVDVTSFVSSSISNNIPDEGFRISYSNIEENDNFTYFVKRFASRHAYDESKHPQLIVKFDDSIQDDSQNLFFDNNSRINFYNYSDESLKNIMSGSSEITGSDCGYLRITSGSMVLEFPFSQFALGNYFQSGIYTSVFNVSSSLSTNNLEQETFNYFWLSKDKTVQFKSGKLKINKSNKSSFKKIKTYSVNVYGLNESYSSKENISLRLNIFDKSENIKSSKLPIILPGKVINNCYYRLRDSVTGEIRVPFDTEFKSTKISSDSEGMFFSFNSSSLIPGRSYIIDILIMDKIYQDASPVFLVRKTNE